MSKTGFFRKIIFDVLFFLQRVLIVLEFVIGAEMTWIHRLTHVHLNLVNAIVFNNIHCVFIFQVEIFY